MARDPVSRRRFLVTAGAAVAGASLLGPPAFGAPPYVRRDVGTLAKGSAIIASYRKAVKKMRALADDDPLSWSYQAAIHGTVLSDPHWNLCEHGTVHFLDWHRMYLYYFERIVRKMSGNPDFALPYWHWETRPKLPLQFRQPANETTNSLYTTNRGTGWNEGTSEVDSFTIDAVGLSMDELAFDDFSSALESPHGTVHIDISGWMCCFETSAQDPIFWLHHCNIDRQWNAWLAKGGGRANPISSSTHDRDWQDVEFTFFDESRNEVKMKPCDIVAAEAQLDYVYDKELPQVVKYCSPKLILPGSIHEVLIKWPPIDLPPDPDPGPIFIDIRALRERLRVIANDPGVDLRLDLTDVLADVQPNVSWNVFVGAPGDARSLTSKSPFFVGQIALFGHGVRDAKAHHAGPAHFSFKIDRAVAAALRQSDTQRLGLQLVARGPNAKRPNTRLTIGGAALAMRTRARQ